MLVGLFAFCFILSLVVMVSSFLFKLNVVHISLAKSALDIVSSPVMLYVPVQFFS